MNSSDIGHSIAVAARTIHHRRNLDETLQAIVETASRSVPAFTHVGISTVRSTGEVETTACTDDLVRHLDDVQYELHEGPCFAALREADLVVASHLRHDQRWPRYVPRAAEAGVRSQLAVKLYLDDEGTLGGINFYSTSTDEVDEDSKTLAQLFAAHAAIALGHAHELEQLNEALHSRKVIGQALGILMERYQLDEDRAFAFLVRASSHGNVKLRQIAQELVNQANTRQPA